MVARIPPVAPDGPVAPVGPKPRDDQIDTFGLTHRGRVRAVNEDHFLLCSLHQTMQVRSTSLPNPELLEMPGERLAFLGMVADGVGGRKAGEEASRSTLEMVAAYCTHSMNCFYNSDPTEHAAFVESLRAAAQDAHAAILERGGQHPELRGLATTLTLFITVWPSVYILHSGDSRAYRLRDGELTQLTRDQTMAQDLIDSGVLPADRKDQSPYAHVLSSAIGGRVNLPDIARHPLDIRDVLLLCTDGLTRHVSDERIREHLLAMASAEETCRALLDEALEGGGKDNITIVIGHATPEAIAERESLEGPS